MAKFRKKPVVIEAVQWTGDNAAEIWEFFPKARIEHIPHVPYVSQYEHNVVIDTLEGEMRGKIGDWIICGIKGEFYPCKPDIFAATYEPVESSPDKEGQS